MLPLIYATSSEQPSATSMTCIGRLTKCIKCEVTEVLNGDYSLSASFSPTDPLIDEVQNQRFISAKSNPFDDNQLFEIHSCSYSQNGTLSINARHIKHCSYNNILLDIYGSSKPAITPTLHFNNAEELLAFDNNFSFSSDISSAKEISAGWTKACSLGEFFEELADVFDGEYHYDNFSITFNQSRGSKKDYLLRWNKNIGSPSLELNTSNIYTHIVAAVDVTINRDGANSVKVRACSEPVRIRTAQSQIQRIKLINGNDYMTIKEFNYNDEGERYNFGVELHRAAGIVANLYNNQIQRAESVNIKVDYKPKLEEMNNIGLADTVDVYLKGGRIIEAKIIKTVYDTLAERWQSIELGQAVDKLSKYIARR